VAGAKTEEVIARGAEYVMHLPCVSLYYLSRSGFGSEPATDNARTGDADPDTSAVDRVVSSSRRRTVSAPADDDVEPARAQSGVSTDVHVGPRPAGRRRQLAQRSSRDSRLDVRMLLQGRMLGERNRPPTGGSPLQMLRGVSIFGPNRCWARCRLLSAMKRVKTETRP